MYCMKCGRKNPDGARFCAGCGSPLPPPPQPDEGTVLLHIPDAEPPADEGTTLLNNPGEQPADEGTTLLNIPGEQPADEGTTLLDIPGEQPADEGTTLLDIPGEQPADEGTTLLDIPREQPADEGTTLLDIPGEQPADEGTTLLNNSGERPSDEGTTLLDIPAEQPAAQGATPEIPAAEAFRPEQQPEAGGNGTFPPIPPEAGDGEHFEPGGEQPLPKKGKGKWLVAAGCILVVIAAAAIGISIFLSKQAETRQVRENVSTGQRYLSELSYEDAIVCFTEAVEVDPKNVEACLGLAQSYNGAQNYEEAEAAYLRLLELDSQNEAAYAQLSELYIRLGRLEEAAALLETAISQVESEEIRHLYEEAHPQPPTFTLEAGSYDQRQEVAMEAGNGCVIRYTLDGTEPDEESPIYQEPVVLPNGDTTIRAVAVSARGYTSDPAQAEYTINVERTEVVFQDEALHDLVCELLGQSARDPLYNEDVERITSLSIVGNELNEGAVTFTQDGYSTQRYSSSSLGDIRSLADLQYMPFLKSLTIAWQEELDASGIENCTRLEELSLLHVGLRNVSPIGQVYSLRRLCLAWNEITDISALKSLTSLTSLGVWGNRISSIDAVGGMLGLTYLDFSDNQVSDISVVAGLQSLNALWMYGNQVSDYSALTGLANLRTLMIRDNPLGDLSDLQQVFYRLNRIDVDVMERGDSR